MTPAVRLRAMVVAAVAAGILAGLVVTLVQVFTTSEWILRAEVREHEVLRVPHPHDVLEVTHPHEVLKDPHPRGVLEVPHPHGEVEVPHGHGEQGSPPHDHWTPEDGLERTLYTALATVLMGVGYGLVLAAALTWLRWTGWRHGLLAGLGGFLVFQLAPSIGLPPQLPGAPEADLLHRQLWWLGTAASTALGLLTLLLARRRAARGWLMVSVVLFCAPHLIGAPAAPAGLQSPQAMADTRVFSLLALATGAIFWALLGAVEGFILGRALPIADLPG